MKIAIGTDHAGFELKESIVASLRAQGHSVTDLGTNSTEAVDYPDFIAPAAEAVAQGDADLGIVLGGSGNGEAIAANKVRGVRCALCHDVTTARLAREHNDANVLSIGARIVGSEVAKDIVRVFLETEFSGEDRHKRRIQKIADLESR